MSKVQTIGRLAKLAVENGGSLIALIETAGLVVGAAQTLIDQTKAVKAGAAELVGENAAQVSADGITAQEVGANALGSVLGTVGTMFSKIGNVREAIVLDLENAKGEKELRRRIQEARQAVLENATTTLSVADLQKADAKSTASPIGPISTMPGSYVIATYKKLDFDRDLTDYTGIFVGGADNTAAAVRSALTREGDPDVYADVKYRQNMSIYVYNCLPDDLEEQTAALVQAFDDERRYGREVRS